MENGKLRAAFQAENALLRHARRVLGAIFNHSPGGSEVTRGLEKEPAKRYMVGL
jgi:hypothetical protein